MNKTIIILIGCILFNSCSKSTYRITEPAPTLEIKALQDTYTLQEPAYIQLKVSQQGYDGEFQVSAVLSEGVCELTMQGPRPAYRRDMGIDVQCHGDTDAHTDQSRNTKDSLLR